MRGIWTLARHTFAQALRMKVAGVFLLLLALALGVMPFAMRGDGTLAGRVRTLLAYGMGVTAVLLSLVTIFVSTSVITSDVRQKQIFSVVTKPLSRWQYVLGRWFGIILLNAVLLTAAMGVIYAVSQYLRGGEALNPTDRRAVETEVFSARAKVFPDSFEKEINKRVKKRIEKLKEAGNFKSALESYKEKFSGDLKRAVEALATEIRKQEVQAVQSVGPGKSLFWRFSNIYVAGTGTSGIGQLQAVNKKLRMVRIKAATELIGRLVYKGPIRLGKTDAQVVRLKKDFFDAYFSIEAMKRSGIFELDIDSDVTIEIDPLIQITYKVKPASKVKDNLIRCFWRFENPVSGAWWMEPQRSDSARLPATLAVSSRIVSDEGKTTALYVNLSPSSVEILRDDIWVSYNVDSFEWNFARAGILIFCQLIFLAALGTLAGSFLSFPVACLLCFGSLPFSMAREFLSDSVKFSASGAETDFLTIVGNIVLKIMSVLLPDFTQTSPGDSLVDGMLISWSYVGQTAGIIVALQSAAILVIACLIFQKRELARVQV